MPRCIKEIYFQENDEVHSDNSEDLESELDLGIEIQPNENDAINAGGSENVAFEGEVNLDNVDSELESTSEDSRVTAEQTETAEQRGEPVNVGLSNESTSSKTHGTHHDSGYQEINDRRKGCKQSDTCNNCPTCVYMFLAKYNMHSAAYKNLYEVYKLALTLPVTQVFCERTFSKLKLLITRLRSTLSTDHLSSLLFIMVENKLVESLNIADIIDNVTQHSSEFCRLLLR